MKVFTVTGRTLPKPEVSAAELATWQAEGSLFNQIVPSRLVSGLEASPVTGCWLSPKYRNHQGYLTVNDAGGRVLHKALARRIRGDVGEGIDVDHLCRNPSCCYPNHTEDVLGEENQLRKRQAAEIEDVLRSGQAFGVLEKGWLADLVDGRIEGVIVCRYGPFVIDAASRMPIRQDDSLLDAQKPRPLPTPGQIVKPVRRPAQVETLLNV